MKIVHSLLIIGLSLLFLSQCNQKEDNSFECTVEYVEFVNASTARVQFVTHLDGVSRTYTVELPYAEARGRITVGDDIVYIENFTARGDTANFDFYYGENLGFFCADLFDVLPEHLHTGFSAEAIRDLSTRTVGKWVIKRKQAI